MDHNIIIAAAVGFFIGAVLVWIIKNTNQNNAEYLQEESETLRKEYEALKKTFADYRNNVNNHFAKTADAVDQLTDSYKNVYNHLSAGARALMDKESLQKQIEKQESDKPVEAPKPVPPPAKPAQPAKPASAEAPKAPVPAEVAKPAAPPAKPATADADKNESPQEALKRHLHNNQGKTP